MAGYTLKAPPGPSCRPSKMSQERPAQTPVIWIVFAPSRAACTVPALGRPRRDRARAALTSPDGAAQIAAVIVSDLQCFPPAALPCPRHADFSIMDQSSRTLFAELTRKQIQRGVHTSVRQIEADIRIFIDLHNKNPKPFKWKPSPLTRFWLQSNGSVTKLSRLYVANFRFT
jgi:hypothetical protein